MSRWWLWWHPYTVKLKKRYSYVMTENLVVNFNNNFYLCFQCVGLLFWFDFHYSVECNWNYLNGISLSWDATIFYSDNNNYITRRRSWQTDIINDVTTIFRDYLYSLKRSDNESNKVFRNIRINVFVFSPIGENYLMLCNLALVDSNQESWYHT